jgi:hypothetical protein
MGWLLDDGGGKSQVDMVPESIGRRVQDRCRPTSSPDAGAESGSTDCSVHQDGYWVGTRLRSAGRSDAVPCVRGWSEQKVVGG